MRCALTLVLIGLPAAAALVTACGGAEATVPGGRDGGSEAGLEAAVDGARVPSDGSLAANDGAGDSAYAAPEAGTVEDAGVACGPPSNPTMAALCLHLVPESIAFTTDPKFDGKGYLLAQVFDTSHPDLPDGGSVPALGTALLPPGATGGASLDLSQGAPTIRFDDLPRTVYVRALFEDDPAATPTRRRRHLARRIRPFHRHPQSAAARAAGSRRRGRHRLRDRFRRAPGADHHRESHRRPRRERAGARDRGRDIGPSARVGVAAVRVRPERVRARRRQQHRADPRLRRSARAPTSSPPWSPILGSPDGGIGASPGSLTSLELLDGGGYDIPAADLLSYPADAYRVSQAVTLGLTLPGGGVDTVSCP